MEDYEAFGNALTFATKAHSNQKRKYTGEDYITHPIAVADMIEEYFDCAELMPFSMPVSTTVAMSVALLHDVVEDTSYNHKDIREQFGDEVAKGVWFLTDVEKFVGNRSLRKKLDRDRLAKAPYWVRLIKKFDIQHNAESIKKHDPKFWGIFKRETDELLEAMCMHSDEYYNGPADIQLAF